MRNISQAGRFVQFSLKLTTKNFAIRCDNLALSFCFLPVVNRGGITRNVFPGAGSYPESQHRSHDIFRFSSEIHLLSVSFFVLLLFICSTVRAFRLFLVLQSRRRVAGFSTLSTLKSFNAAQLLPSSKTLVFLSQELAPEELSRLRIPRRSGLLSNPQRKFHYLG